MPRQPRSELALGLLLLLAARIACAQAPPTIEQGLRKKHIPNTPAALQKALTSPDPQTRGMAAVALADLHSTASLPDLRRAASQEHSSSTRLSMASALTTLGDTQAATAIHRSLCLDPAASEADRIDAADQLLPGLDQPCAAAIARIVAKSSEPRMLAGLLTLTHVPLRSAPLFGKDPSIVTAVTRGLQSSAASVRMQAAKCATVLQVRDASPALHQALRTETDPETRQVLQLAANLLSP